MRDAEPLLRRIEALEQRYRELYLPFAETAVRIVKDLRALPDYFELQDTLFEVNLKCPTPSSFEAVERKLLRNQYACVCEFIEDTRLVVTNIYQYVEEDILAWPAARRIERVMEDRFVTDLHRPKLHTFVEDRLRECSQGVVRKIQRVLDAYGEVDTPFRNLSHSTLQAICRCLPDMNPPLDAPSLAAPTIPLVMGDGSRQATAAPQPTTQPAHPPSPATPAMTTMQQNAHTATFFQEISPVHLSDGSDFGDEDGGFGDGVMGYSGEPTEMGGADSQEGGGNDNDNDNADVDGMAHTTSEPKNAAIAEDTANVADIVGNVPIQRESDAPAIHEGGTSLLEFD